MARSRSPDPSLRSRRGPGQALGGKRCIVTGASSGVGLAIAQRFARDGARLALVARTRTRLDAAARTLSSAAACLALPADVTRDDHARGVVERVAAEMGGIDVLVNAAGVAYFRPIGETSVEHWDEVLDANLKGVFLMCKHAAPRMLGAGRGDIVNIGSIAAHQGFKGATAYCASKHGLLGFSRALALEVRQRGLRVITVSPGSVDTPLWERSDWSPEKTKMLRAEDVAEAVYAALTISDNAAVDELIVMPRAGVL